MNHWDLGLDQHLYQSGSPHSGVVCIGWNIKKLIVRLAMAMLLQVELIADKTGGLVRLLGLEFGDPSATSGPRCQRYAGIVEDGILLKLVRTSMECAPGHVCAHAEPVLTVVIH